MTKLAITISCPADQSHWIRLYDIRVGVDAMIDDYCWGCEYDEYPTEVLALDWAIYCVDDPENVLTDSWVEDCADSFASSGDADEIDSDTIYRRWTAPHESHSVTDRPQSIVDGVCHY